MCVKSIANENSNPQSIRVSATINTDKMHDISFWKDSLICGCVLRCVCWLLKLMIENSNPQSIAEGGAINSVNKT